MKKWSVKCYLCKFHTHLQAETLGEVRKLAKEYHPHNTDEIYFKIVEYGFNIDNTKNINFIGKF